MIGSPIARQCRRRSPGRGYHWGMATPSPVLPRGTRILMLVHWHHRRNFTWSCETR